MRTISIEDIYESTAQLSIYITTQHYTDPLYTDQYKDQHKVCMVKPKMPQLNSQSICEG